MDCFVVIVSPLKALSLAGFSTSTSALSLSLFKSKSFKKCSATTAQALSPRNPSRIWHGGEFPAKPFSYIIPFFQKLRDFALKSSNPKGVSTVHDCSLQEADFLQSGAFGTALMSVTTTAKVKISPFVATLAANPTFVSGLCAWAAAQSVKVFLHFVMERKWDFKIMFASGGMPSSHSALCTALTTSVAICHGVADSLFPVCLGFTLIVMYDAAGVRRHAGMQAEVLNLIVGVLFEGHPISQRKLKELLGHTPSQVFGGALLGIVVAWMCCLGLI